MSHDTESVNITLNGGLAFPCKMLLWSPITGSPSAEPTVPLWSTCLSEPARNAKISHEILRLFSPKHPDFGLNENITRLQIQVNNPLTLLIGQVTLLVTI